nr:hypothetical protein [Mycobacterium ulcerans]
MQGSGGAATQGERVDRWGSGVVGGLGNAATGPVVVPASWTSSTLNEARFPGCNAGLDAANAA